MDKIAINKRAALLMFWSAGFNTEALLLSANKALGLIKQPVAGFYYAADVHQAIEKGAVMNTHNKPLAAIGLLSYRYKGAYGYIMIGAHDNEDALREAGRSTSDKLSIARLEAWSDAAQCYLAVQNQSIS